MSDILYMLWYCQLLGLWDFLAHGLSSDKGSSTLVSQGEMELSDLGAVLNPPMCHLCIWKLTQNRLSKCLKPKVAHTKALEKLQVKPRFFFFFFSFCCGGPSVRQAGFSFCRLGSYSALVSLVVVFRLLSCDTRAYLPCGMWDLSSSTRDWTCVPCIARQILNHWTPREVPKTRVYVAFSKLFLLLFPSS